jgi:hypothetical protein
MEQLLLQEPLVVQVVLVKLVQTLVPQMLVMVVTD